MHCSALLSFLLVAGSFKAQTVEACDPLPGWEEQTFLERAAQADIIAYGKVIDLTPIAEWQQAWPNVYDAEFEFYCVLRESITFECPPVGPDQFGICVDECGEFVDNRDCPGDQMCCPNGCGHVCTQPVQMGGINQTAIVRDMGELTSCSRTIVEIGTTYIILLQWRDGELVPHEINIQSAAFPETQYVWDDISILCDVEAVAPLGRNNCPSNVTDGIPTVRDTPCYSTAPSQAASVMILALVVVVGFLKPIFN